MEQTDSIKQEIQKTGLLLRSTINLLISSNNSLSISTESPFETTKGKLIEDLDLDLEQFLSLDKTESQDYICSFKGFNQENLALLAELLYLIGMREGRTSKNMYIIKALCLYDLCDLTDNLFTINRH